MRHRDAARCNPRATTTDRRHHPHARLNGRSRTFAAACPGTASKLLHGPPVEPGYRAGGTFAFSSSAHPNRRAVQQLGGRSRTGVRERPRSSVESCVRVMSAIGRGCAGVAAGCVAMPHSAHRSREMLRKWRYLRLASLNLRVVGSIPTRLHLHRSKPVYGPCSRSVPGQDIQPQHIATLPASPSAADFPAAFRFNKCGVELPEAAARFCTNRLLLCSESDVGP